MPPRQKKPPAVYNPPVIDTVHPYTTVYTDGSSTGAVGPSGWAWAVHEGPQDSGFEENSTNQRAEITAAFEAVKALPGLLLVVADSQYVINCLAAETEFVTRDGIKQIGDVVGQVVEVRDGHNAWVRTVVKSYGTQPLRRVTFTNGRQRKVVHATAGHRWLVARGPQAKVPKSWTTTDELRPGNWIPKRSGRNGSYVATVSPTGVQAGFIFGDGSATVRHGARAVLCGDKDAALLKFFSGVEFTRQKDGALTSPFIFPRHWKTATPDLTSGSAFLMGWLAGYFAADGCVTDNGSAMLHSADRDNIEFVRSLCAAVLHIGTGPVKTQWRRGYGVERSPIYALTFTPGDLPEDFFLIEHHRQRIAQAAAKARRAQRWTVLSVEETDRNEEVFCVEVPTTTSFLLSDGLLTGNCFEQRWYLGWARRGWRNSQGDQVKNRDLWEPFIDTVLARNGEVKWHWVKGHSNDLMNDYVDRLAKEARLALQQQLAA